MPRWSPQTELIFATLGEDALLHMIRIVPVSGLVLLAWVLDKPTRAQAVAS
jgi:hypothetical protein